MLIMNYSRGRSFRLVNAKWAGISPVVADHFFHALGREAVYRSRCYVVPGIGSEDFTRNGIDRYPVW